MKCIFMNWCDVTDPKFRLSNPFLMKIFKTVKIQLKQVFKPCPFPLGIVGFEEFAPNDDYVNFLPRGIWKVSGHFFSDVDENIFTAHMYYVIHS